ncbi:MAG: zinc metallopeptidase [Anaerolineales bacterium]|nr:zinc metallopeptidase [Anaerolineales bacterium]
MFLSLDYLLCMVPAFILMALASWYVRATYRKWSRIQASSRLTGFQAAQRLIGAAGLTGVEIKGVAGEMSDHYDPRDNTLYLSRGVSENPSVAALAVAAHELGHALQDRDGYLPLRFRSALVPMVNIGSSLGWILIVLGLFLSYAGMAFGVDIAWLGVIAFSGGAVFALATLPVELNASARARELLTNAGIIAGQQEQRGVRSVLNAAALTYVAGLVTAVLQLLYFISLVGGRRR